ncbi:MAG: hypothetical protein JSU58_10230 [Dehalococcoidales bacterium]|nr:MAG: hypothetical protein JSU58_10230 [Dehalococcoidales bacterium]
MTQDNRTLEQVYRSAVKGLYARITSYYNYIYDRFGQEGLDMISEMSREYGESIVPRAKEALGKNDIESVAEYLLRIFRTVDWNTDGIKLVSKSPEEIVITVEYCPLHFKNPELCLAHTTMEKTVVEGLNPDIEYIIARSIPAGDGFCEHILRLKTEPDSD